MANQLMSCHWISNGLEVEYCIQREGTTDSVIQTIDKTSKRKHSWQLAQL